MTLFNKQTEPVFVIGSPRSGTSILSRLIREYLNISFGTESQFIIRFYKRLSQYGNLQQDRNLKTLLDDIGEERCFKRWQKFGYRFDFDRIFARIDEKSYTGVLDAIFTDLAVHNNMERWGDKTPEYIYNLDVLQELFPKAKFIHIVRDGRDVALSTLKIHFGAKNIGVAAIDWNRQIECVSQFKKSVCGKNLIEFRYEDFLDKPVKLFVELISFLGIDDIDGTIRARIEKSLSGELYRNNYYKWKTQLKKEHKIIFEKINFDYLKDYNYPTITEGQRKISKVEKLFWRIDNKVRQLKRFDTWQDNLYKLNIRFRHLKRRINRIGNS